MTEPQQGIGKSSGLTRVINALGNSSRGFTTAIRNDAAIREALIGLAIFVPVSAVLPVSDLEHLVLVLSMMLVVLMEFVNSAIETVVDRISLERHPLSGHAKDLASVAVGIAFMMAGLCWVVIAGPVLVRSLQ